MHHLGCFFCATWKGVLAEFDAMLVSQCAGKPCSILALGGASKKPDSMTHRLLLKAPLILFALDFDEAGNKAYRFWKEAYPNVRSWPVPEGKAPCEAAKAGVDLSQWVRLGIEYFKPVLDQRLNLNNSNIGLS